MTDPRGWAVSVLSAAGVLLGEADLEAATAQMHLALEAAYLRGRVDVLTEVTARLNAAVGKAKGA